MIPDTEMRLLRKLKHPSLRLGLGLGLPAGGNNVPRLFLDFINSTTLDPRITFTRASAGTRVNSSGLIENITSGNPRFDYDPVTLAAKGLLIEEQRTNLTIHSEDMSSWTAANTTVSTNTDTAPDGNVTADRLTGSAGTVVKRLGLSTTAIGTHSVSIFAKGGTQSKIQIISSNNITFYANFDLAAGTIGTVGAGATAVMRPYGNGWYRCSITYANANNSEAWYVYFTDSTSATWAPTSSSTGYIILWGAQDEVGDFPTSYIPMTSAQVTRSADVASMTGTNFSSWFNPAQGTIYAEGDYLNGSGSATFTNEGLYALGDPTIPFSSGQAIYMQRNAATTQLALQVNVGGVNQASLGMGTVSANAQVRVASAYAANDFASSMNGVAPITDISGALPAPTTLSLGSFVAGWTGAQNQMNGHFRRFRYYIPRVPNTTLQQLKP